MKNSSFFRTLFSLMLCVVLCAATVTGVAESADSLTEETPAERLSLGEGNVSFLFSVVNDLGEEIFYEIFTDAETVGEALLAARLIGNDIGPYGLYVKTVNGILADYEINGHYWAFYIDGEYALSGVDQTKIEPEHKYALKFE